MQRNKEEGMVVDSAEVSGAKQIVQRCLGLTKGQNLLIFADKTTSDVASILAETAEQLSVQATIIFIPVSQQRRIPAEMELSLLAQGAAKEAWAILNCVNSSAECTPFRKFILETQWGARTKVGHMPGANLKVLQLASADFNKLISDCHSVEIALARGRALEFISHAADGTLHSLTADIGGWERLPVASDGVISNGVWGNVPSGETYIAPIEGSAEGSIVINGSIPGLLIRQKEEIVIHFHKGRVITITPEDNRTALFLKKEQIDRALDAGDENWRNLAEIGIGLNPAVDRLTGNMLFDEKKAGTAHIALGLNTFMGGLVNSKIHCDMVVRSPTIIVDGKTIVKKGRLRFVDAEWRESHRDISLQESPLRTAHYVSRSGIEASINNHHLARVLRPEPGRVSTCPVGDDETARLAQKMYTILPGDNTWSEIQSLAAAGDSDVETVRRILHLIWEYGLINYR
jgi:leucyl aminopeptidase (aminopeptidase T)